MPGHGHDTQDSCDILLLPVGFFAGALTNDINPDKLFGAAFPPLVSLGVAIILFDGGLDLTAQRCEGWHGRSGSERRAVWVVLATRTNHPNSETGRAVFQCAAGRTRSTTSCNVTGLQVRPNPPALPKLIRTSNQAVDPQRSINVLGHPLSCFTRENRWMRCRFPCAHNVATTTLHLSSRR